MIERVYGFVRKEFARFLSKKQKELGLSLREIGRKEFSAQTLSNYQRGNFLPPKENLERLATCYKVTVNELRKLYDDTVFKVSQKPLQLDEFIEVLEGTGKKDHIVVISQNSIFINQPNLLSEFLKFVEKGVYFTNVMYEPKNRSFREASNWEGNQNRAAKLLFGELASRPGTLMKHIYYLIIRSPTSNDFALIRPYEATFYLCKYISPLEGSCVWTEMEDPDGRHWWYSRNYDFQSTVHSWLIDECGLVLLSNRFNTLKGKSVGERKIEMLSIEEYLKTL